MSLLRAPEGIEWDLLRLVGSQERMTHDDPRLAPFCDDASTMTKPDVFNRCHDLEWLRSSHDSDSDVSRVFLTDAGRSALSEDRP